MLNDNLKYPISSSEKEKEYVKLSKQKELLEEKLQQLFKKFESG